jgi:hypothetical protein
MTQSTRTNSQPSSSERKDIDHLVIGAKDLISATEGWIQQASEAEWNPSPSSISFYHLVLRTIVVKQYESIQSILTFEHCSQGFSAVPLLRAMCEELIWAKYLASHSEEDSSRIVQALGAVGIHETFLAQEGYPIPNTGFSDEWKAYSTASCAVGRADLKRLFVKHGFKLKPHQTVPSVSQIAKSISMYSIYGFLYHATSRAVHFSVPELLRRIWGKPGRMTISSQTFERYWAAFAIYWGSWLYARTFLEVLLLLQTPDFTDEKINQIRAAIDLMRKDGAIPILTNEEVFWPNEWR